MLLVDTTALLWGALVLAAGFRVAARAVGVDRALALRNGSAPVERSTRLLTDALDRLGTVGRVVNGARRRRAAARRDRLMARELPSAVDLLAVAMSAGATPFGAVDTVARWAPPTVAETFGAVVAACGLGASFEHAMTDAAQRDARLGPLVTVLATGARLGAAVNDALVRLAAEARRDLRRRAEARARTVPVRLLFPLVFLVLPAFGLLTVVPAVVAGLHGL